VLKQLHIKLTGRFKKPQNSNKVTSGLLKILSIVLYPLILIIGLITILFAAVVSLFQKRPTESRENLIAKEQAFTEPWSILTEQGRLKIFRKYAGEVSFGPAYLNLKSNPAILFLTDKIFGDWFFHYDHVLLLQQWNSTENPNTNLIAIDTMTFDTAVLQQNIPSVFWDIVETEPNNLQLTCDTGSEILKYSINSSQFV
jgi:hypothetical protein